VDLAIASEETPPIDMGDRFVLIDCGDTDASVAAIVALATSTPVDAVVAVDDVGVEIAVRAAERLGLPHSDVTGVDATLNKLSMRDRLRKAEVHQPEHAPIRHSDEVDVALDQVGYPAVIKPISMSASRGVIRVDTLQQAEAAVARIRGILADSGHELDEPLIVERFVPGPEVAVEAMAWGDHLEILAIFDKPDPMDGPYFEETIYVTPSRRTDTTEIEHLVGRAASALGITHGPVHAEVRIEDGTPTLVEIAARSIGGLCGRSLRFGLMGSTLEMMILRQALAMEKPGLRRERTAAGVLMVPIPRSGVLLGFEGVAETQAIPGITGFEQTIPTGELVRALPEGDRYLGFVFARSETPEAVETALRAARDTLVPLIR